MQEGIARELFSVYNLGKKAEKSGLPQRINYNQETSSGRTKTEGRCGIKERKDEQETGSINDS